MDNCSKKPKVMERIRKLYTKNATQLKDKDDDVGKHIYLQYMCRIFYYANNGKYYATFIYLYIIILCEYVKKIIFIFFVIILT